MTKKQFDALHGAAYRVFLADGEAFNKRLREQKEKVQTLKKISERRKAIGELHDAIANTVRSGAVDKAVSLANGSTLAQEFGYKPLLN
jgi:diphthamide synthase (EF-2-diphthine--ammonia ligase)